MPIPPVLKDYVDLLRTEIQGATHRTSTLQTNGATYTDSIRPYVQMTPAIDAALAKAKTKSQGLAKKLSSISASMERASPEIVRARQKPSRLWKPSKLYWQMRNRPSIWGMTGKPKSIRMRHHLPWLGTWKILKVANQVI